MRTAPMNPRRVPVRRSAVHRGIIVVLLALAVTSPVQAQNRRAVSTEKAPKAIGPYSQAVIAGKTVYVSGQLGLDPSTGSFVPGGIREQTAQALRNIQAVLEAAGCTMQSVVSCSVFLKDLNDFTAMNEIYAAHFSSDPPARATIQAARLPKDGLVEIGCIAVLP
jgi:2-iminobutanoate/2-iminopropanoate deaminase